MNGPITALERTAEAPSSSPASETRPPVRVLEVVKWAPRQPGLRGFAIDAPAADGQSLEYGLDIVGWALGETAPARVVEIWCRGVKVGTMAVQAERKDLRSAFADLEWAGRAGFRGRVNTILLPAAFEIEVVAVLSDGGRAPVGKVRAERTTPCVVGEDFIQPLILTTLGRSGSTWVTQLLGQHPEVSSYKPFMYEPRPAGYWFSMLASISEPASYRRLLRPPDQRPGWWLGSTERGHLPVSNDEGMERWLGRTHVEALLPVCVQQVEAYYRESVRLQNETGVRYVIEKFSADSFLPILLCDLYPRGVEIILVRDFRDMVVSMMAYNRKRNMTAFGRDRVSSDEEFIRWWRGGARIMVDEWRARSDTAFLLKYEDLIQEPVATLEKLARFVGLDADRRLLEQVLQRSMAITPEKQRYHMTSGDAAASIGRWRRDLSEAERRAASETFDDLLVELGYTV